MLLNSNERGVWTVVCISELASDLYVQQGKLYVERVDLPELGPGQHS